MSNDNTIDESLYSRQLYVLGMEAMKSMNKSNILITGLSGLGVEVAKNIILSGVKSVTLHDTLLVTIDDLGTNYYCKKRHINMLRAEVVRDKLAELNNYVDVKVCTTSLTEEYIKQFTVVISTQYNTHKTNLLSDISHKHNIPFILCESRSVFGRIFCDFGENFTVYDTNGEREHTSLISDIQKEEDNYLVTCIESQPHQLCDGNYVIIRQVDGMDKFEDSEPFKVEVVDRFTIKINIDKDYGTYIKGGMIKQVKQPEIVSFKSFTDSYDNPEFVMTDFMNFNRPAIMHSLNYVINCRSMTMKSHPDNLKLEDSLEHINKSLDEKLKSDFPDIELTDNDRKLVRKYVLTYNSSLIAMNSVIGGMAAQEGLKACSGKFMPIKQWLYFDSYDSLPLELASDLDVKGSRYQSQIRVFGKEFQQKLSDLNLFVVGSGAIGCELLKNFSMSGCCTDKGTLTVTDMDIIERSNLNRQFLFRSTDIGKLKSEAAADAVLRMNDKVNVVSHSNKVGPDSENVYNSKFFDKLDIVANALDNLEARKYVDARCVLFGKPLLESGTLGTKGNTQVIVPRLTESYGSSSDPPEVDIPLCTLKHFPNDINHTIEWAKDKFIERFTNSVMDAKKYLEDSTFLDSMSIGDMMQTVKNINSILVDNYSKTFDDCVKHAYNIWHLQFVHNILNLQTKFPKNHKTKEDVLFWSGAKKYPDVFKFDSSNEYHYAYIESYANLLASVFNIKNCRDNKYIINVLSKLKEPEFTVDSNVHISVTDAEEKDKVKEMEDETNIDDVKKHLPKIDKYKDLKLESLEFEKDDDSNFHIDFITACSNMRALNYSIDTESKHVTKGIAGKIIPAIATTTAIVAGLCMLELYKLVHKHDKLEQYRNTYLNLAIPLLQFTEPVKAEEYKFNNKTYNMWDNIKIEKDITLRELIDITSKEIGSEVDMVLYNSLNLYSFFLSPAEAEKRKNMKVTDIIYKLSNKKINTDVIKLTISAEPEEEDEEADLPYVMLKL